MPLEMNILITIAALVATSLADSPVVKINGTDYLQQELLFPDTYKELRHLTYDRNKHTVYFTYKSGSSMNAASLNFRTGKFVKLDVGASVTCLQIDSETGTLYLGTEMGLSMVVPKDSHKATTLLVLHNEFISSVFYKKELFYYVSLDKGAYQFELSTNEKKQFPRIPNVHFDKFVIDDKEYIIYMNRETKEGFWVRYYDVMTPTKFDINVTDVAVDQNFKAYVSTPNALHYFDNKALNLIKVADIKDTDRMSLEDVGIPIVISNGKIRRLTRTHEPCTEETPPAS